MIHKIKRAYTLSPQADENAKITIAKAYHAALVKRVALSSKGSKHNDT